MNKKFWAVVLLLPLLAFCGKKDQPEDKDKDKDKQEEVDPSIVISGDSEFSFPLEGGSGTLTFTSNVDWTATAGAVPFATDFYGTGSFAVTNLALTAAKDIRITDTFSIPVFAQVAANPCSRAAFLVFGITLHP